MRGSTLIQELLDCKSAMLMEHWLRVQGKAMHARSNRWQQLSQEREAALGGGGDGGGGGGGSRSSARRRWRWLFKVHVAVCFPLKERWRGRNRNEARTEKHLCLHPAGEAASTCVCSTSRWSPSSLAAVQSERQHPHSSTNHSRPKRS